MYVGRAVGPDIRTISRGTCRSSVDLSVDSATNAVYATPGPPSNGAVRVLPLACLSRLQLQSDFPMHHARLHLIQRHHLTIGQMWELRPSVLWRWAISTRRATSGSNETPALQAMHALKSSDGCAVDFSSHSPPHVGNEQAVSDGNGDAFGLVVLRPTRLLNPYQVQQAHQVRQVQQVQQVQQVEEVEQTWDEGYGRGNMLMLCSNVMFKCYADVMLMLYSKVMFKSNVVVMLMLSSNVMLMFCCCYFDVVLMLCSYVLLMLWWCYDDVMMMLCWCYIDVMLMLCWYYVDAMLMLCWCCVDVMLMLLCWCWLFGAFFSSCSGTFARVTPLLFCGSSGPWCSSLTSRICNGMVSCAASKQSPTLLN